jgi:hypothetical protein
MRHGFLRETIPRADEEDDMRSKILASLAALSLLGASGGAAARPAATLSLGNSPALVRAGADTEGASDFLRGGRLVLAAIVLGLVVWGAIELLDDNEEAFPTSP